ncbi:MAG TPA: cyclic nucleotide-binding domain-containing protein [Pyrinomonadaceae bacterium]|jgi:CRP-like cAMP-binding protein
MNEQYAALITELNRSFTLDEAQKLLDSCELKEDVRGNLRSQGDGATSILLLLIGKVEIFVGHDGKAQVIGHVEAGKFLGLSALRGIPRNASIRTSEPSVVLEWTLKAFRDLLLQNPSLSEKVLGRSLPTPVEEEH